MGVRLEVTAPTVAPLPFGLLSVAQLIDEADPHWRQGIQFQPDACEKANVWAAVPCSGAPPSKTPTSTGIPTRASDPFAVYAWLDCAPIGTWDEFKTRTVAALTAGEGRAVEHEFWTGAGGLMPHLAEDTAVVDAGGEVIQPAATVLSATAVSIVEAVALLEGAMADCYGGVPTIHAPRRALAYMAQAFELQQTGMRLTTKGGSLLAFGGGYPGTSPAGADPAAGKSWLYATGAVRVTRDAVPDVPDRGASLGRLKNDMVMIAERNYVVAWDCCLFAVLADTGTVALP